MPNGTSRVGVAKNVIATNRSWHKYSANGRPHPSLPEIRAVQHWRFFCALEIELKPQLHLARLDCHVRDAPEGIITDIGIRRPEYRVI